MFGLWNTSFRRLGALGIVLTACNPPGAGNAVPVGAPAEFELDSSDPDPPDSTPVLRPCLKDEPGGCGETVEQERGTEVVTGGHYTVPVLASDPVRGPAAAPVTLVVFSDFQCPFCGAFEETLAELTSRYPDTLKIVWKDNPLPMHPHARPAALLARNAYARGGNDGFWLVHDRIFRDQADIGNGALEIIARDFALAWPPPEHVAPLVDLCVEQAIAIGAHSTPTSFVNGHAVVGSHPVETYVELLDRELARAGVVE